MLQTKFLYQTTFDLRYKLLIFIKQFVYGKLTRLKYKYYEATTDWTNGSQCFNKFGN
jgi:hypothetical protein